MTYYLSFDVEKWFHAHNLRPAVGTDECEDRESRVKRGTCGVLELLDEHECRATFFTLGWVADRHPDLVREIAAAGHEIASHGYNHELLYEQSRAAVREDLQRSLDTLKPLVEGPVLGYRAPSFSITD